MTKRLELAPPPPPELTPLEYLLSVMRDPKAAIELRVEAAIACLPYCHRPLWYPYPGADGCDVDE